MPKAAALKRGIARWYKQVSAGAGEGFQQQNDGTCVAQAIIVSVQQGFFMCLLPARSGTK